MHAMLHTPWISYREHESAAWVGVSASKDSGDSQILSMYTQQTYLYTTTTFNFDFPSLNLPHQNLAIPVANVVSIPGTTNLAPPLTNPRIPLQLHIQPIHTLHNMFADKQMSPDWLRLHPLPATRDGVTNLASGSPAPQATGIIPVILNLATFESWSTFDADAATIGDMLKRLSPSDEYLNVVSGRIAHSNKVRVSVNRQYQDESTCSTMGAADATAAFDSMIQTASQALLVPKLREGLLSHPCEIFARYSESICCSKRLEMTGVIPETVSKVDPSGRDDDELGASPTNHVATSIIKPEISLYTLGASHKMPILAAQVTTPALQFAKQLTPSDGGMMSAAEKVSELFKRVREGRSSLKGPDLRLFLAIHQTIVYALQTESQCAILTNFNETLFLRIANVTVKHKTSKELRIAVSSLFDGNSVFCGVVACYRNVFSRDYSSTSDWEARVSILRSLIDDDVHSTESSALEGAPNKKKRRRVGRGFGSSSMRKSLLPDTFFDSPFYFTRASPEKELSGRALYRIMNKNHGFLSEHGYNRVMKCRLRGQPVAVKYFYCLEERKVPSKIEHESNMHALMEARCDDRKYGDFVAELLAYGRVNAFGMVIVTAYVGKSVTMSDSQLLVGRESVLDVDALSAAAVRSLKRIHELKVLHGDVALRNIRAQRNGENDWQVWWLDFGHARECRHDTRFREEERVCLQMFQRAKRSN